MKSFSLLQVFGNVSAFFFGSESPNKITAPIAVCTSSHYVHEPALFVCDGISSSQQILQTETCGDQGTGASRPH